MSTVDDALHELTLLAMSKGWNGKEVSDLRAQVRGLTPQNAQSFCRAKIQELQAKNEDSG